MPQREALARHLDGPVLCLDIGSGTQDVLLARPGLEPENWARFVLPSPARLIAQRIRALAQVKRAVWLYGHNMGGGFARAVLEHKAAGLGVACTLQASTALHDNAAKVADMGVELCEQAPAGHVPVYLSDYDPAFWQGMLHQACLPLPHLVLAAVQDHGVDMPGQGQEQGKGNRVIRMTGWRHLLASSPHPERWLYRSVPAAFTRLAALQAATGGPVADTGTAAICGALCLPEVLTRSQREGVTVINVGNSHTVAALVYKGRVHGLFEHHTGQRSLEHLLEDLRQFRLGWLPDEEVRATGGHGTAFGEVPEEAGGFMPTFVLGPRREMLRGHGQFIAPYGDMMLAGCYGLLRAHVAQMEKAVEAAQPENSVKMQGE